MATAACQHINMTTCERPLQGSEAPAGQLQKATPEADVLSSSCCPPLAGFFWRKKEGGYSVRPHRRALSGCPLLLSSQSVQSCPPHVLLLLLLPSCCPSSGVWPRLPAYLRSCSSRRRLVFLLSSLPLLRLFSSALSGHSLSSFRPLGVFVLFSFPHPFVLCCNPHVLPWSFCCPVLSCCSRYCFVGPGVWLPTTTTILADEAVWGLCWHHFILGILT